MDFMFGENFAPESEPKIMYDHPPAPKRYRLREWKDRQELGLMCCGKPYLLEDIMGIIYKCRYCGAIWGH